MKIKETGRLIAPKDFRKLNYCLGCSHKLEIPKKSFCRECLDKGLTNCEMCECRLEKGLHKHYYYYSGEFDKDEVVVRTNKTFLREFLEETEYDNKYNDTLCKSCKGWKKKNKCFMCLKGFKNSRENYKLNGNLCGDCVIRFQ